jgi:transposase
MENVPVFVGLDYHSRSVQVCVVDSSGTVLVNRRCGNSVMEICGALGAGREVRRAAVESCCGAADLAEALIKELSWPLSMAHPGYVARMKHNPDKTDFGDARMLAELARAGLIPPVWLAPQSVRELRLLVRLRADLVGTVRAVKTRILAVLRQQRIAEPTLSGRWSRKWLAWLGSPECGLSVQGRFAVEVYLEELAALRARIGKVEARLGAATAGDAVVERLLTIKGVGEVTAWTMRALIGRFDRFANGKQLARFCAVTPRNASSGQRVADSGMIKAGDPQLKSVVVEAAQRLRRYEPRWQELSASMAARGKPASVIVGAVANRWLRGLYHQMKELPMAA